MCSPSALLDDGLTPRRSKRRPIVGGAGISEDRAVAVHPSRQGGVGSGRVLRCVPAPHRGPVVRGNSAPDAHLLATLCQHGIASCTPPTGISRVSFTRRA